MINDNNCMHTAYLDELIASAAKAVGFLGIVCDGYVRDCIGCVKLGLPIFAKGFIQKGPQKENPVKINRLVRCGGIIVNPSDLMVGDCKGVTVVSRGKIAEVIKNAQKKLDYENKRMDTIAAYYEAKENGDPLPLLVPQWVLDMCNPVEKAEKIKP